MYNKLIELQAKSEAFYFSDQDVTVNNKIFTIRSFSYRLASWMDFQMPFAKESRGTAYYSEKDKDDWKLFTRSFPKFFNLGEGIDKHDYMKLHEPLQSYEKMDGSLILIGQIEDKLIVKSKSSINSDQAILAQELIDSNKEYQIYIKNVIKDGFTPVFELIGKKNVIVLRYDVQAELTLLANIDNESGTITKDITDAPFRTPKVYNYNWEELLNIQETSTPDIEGFVTYVPGDMVKVKCAAYVQLHYLKDSINNKKALAMLILDDNIDDLIGSYAHDEDTVQFILDTQDYIFKKYNHIVKRTEDAYKDSNDLDRKEFAVHHKLYNPDIFGLLMNMYLGRHVDYKEYFMKNKLYEVQDAN